ncbi:fibronectin type III domain-containing [Chlorella sorokiniana]|uniref:Fibronectin type III domain-containing n=1 Tax=Chlorella sorokiniana TaxID=3076 RepID=A0A2P6TE50_CHLSO|nr:fibronectin type III domain-containing [Chlorella sorokiniana]|eukprot:PRW20918.1 fibronectin type III domain-containing [Chlorella sorokiniana]
MGCRPALALLLLAAVALLHCCSPAFAEAAAGGLPALDAAGISLSHSVRHLLQAVGASAGALECNDPNQPYKALLTLNAPGRYSFRIKAKSSNGLSATGVTSATVLVGKPSAPRNVTYTSGVGQVTISWEAPQRNPDPATTSYWLYVTPDVSSTRRLLGEGKTAFAELKPSSGSGALAPAGGAGSFASPFTATAAIPAGNYTLQLSASNANGYSGLSPSSPVSVGFSTKPRFWKVQGSAGKTTLQIIRPDSVSDPANLRYKVTILKAGDSGSGIFRAAALEAHTGTGTLDDPAVIDIDLNAANFGSGTAFAQAKFVVLACNGTISCAPDSTTSDTVTIGVPPAPVISSFAAASLSSLTVSWAKALTAVRYEVQLKQTGSGNGATVGTAVVDGGSDATFSKTFGNLAPGSYSVDIYAINTNGDKSSTATPSSDTVVGAPLPASITSVDGGVGQLTVAIDWSKTAINADLGVIYTLNIQDVTAGRSPATPLATATLTAGAPSQTIPNLVAGTKRVWIVASNANTDTYSAVVKSDWAGVVAVQLSSKPGITQAPVGSATGTNISVTAPSATSTTAINKFLIQAFHAIEDRELGRPVQVDAEPSGSAGPWTVFFAQTVPQRLRFKVAAQSDDRTVTSDWSDLSSVVSVGTPAKPDQLSAQGGISQLSLSWAAVDTAESYRVRIYRSGQLVQTLTKTAPTASHTETGLLAGMYTVKVAAVSANGVTGSDAEAGPVTVGKPGKPDAPTTTSGIGNLTIKWQAPAQDPNPANTVYFAKIYRAVDDGLVVERSLAGPSGSGAAASPFEKTIDLPFGQYKVTVFGRILVDGAVVNGDGEESDNQLPQVPGQYKFKVYAIGGPTNLSTLALTDVVTVGIPATPGSVTPNGGLSSATIAWSASPTSAYYLVELLYQGVVKKSAQVEHSNDLTFSYTFDQVAAGTYTFKLTAINANNDKSSPFTTGSVLVGVPSQPRLTAAVGAVGSASITWQQPTFNPSPDPAATAYWLRTYLVNSATGTWAEQGAPVTADAGTVTRTLPAGVYRFALYANNTNGDGPLSDLSDPVTVGFASAVTSVTAEGGRTQADITFTAPAQLSAADQKVAKFRVQAIREDGLVIEEARELALAAPVDKSTASLQLAFAWPSGEPQRLKFRLAATDGTAVGDWSAESNTVTVGQPAAPVIRASDGLIDSATVTFDAAPYATSYDLRLLRCTGTTAATCTVQIDTKSSQTSAGQHTFGSISNPGLYVIEVKATAANGVASNAATTPILLVGKPSAPAKPTVTAGVGNVTLSWTAPTSNPDPTGVVDATSYTLRAYSTDGATLINTQALEGVSGQGPFSKTVTLVAGTWKARIVASNEHGESASDLSEPFTVEVTSKPVIQDVQGGPSGLTLEVFRPSDISAADARYINYLVQLAPRPQRLTAEVIADAGSTRTVSSRWATLVVVGTPDKTSITQVEGSASDTAPHTVSVTFSKSATATSYTATLVDEQTGSTVDTKSLSGVADSEAGPWTLTLTANSKGTYTVKVVASNIKTTPSPEALSDVVVVGRPEKPAVTDVTPAVGKFTLKWSAAAVNALIGTRYTALLYRPTNLTAPIFSLALAADGTTAAGTTSFSEELALPAGPYRLVIATANVRGDGAKSSMTSEFSIDNMSDSEVATYLIQAYSDEALTTKVGSEVRGNNTADGADGVDAAFIFPYPYTAAAELYFTVTVVVGGTRSPASQKKGPVVVGTPGTPRLASPLGGKDGATFTFTAVPTAVKYVVTASKDGTALQPARTVTDASAQQVWSLADLGGEPGEFTFSVVAENGNGAQSEAATTPAAMVVGTPGAPAWVASNPVVPAPGTATLSWTAPAYNAKIDTRYFVQLYRGANGPAFGSLVALTPAQGGNGTAQAPFTATISVSAGSWSYKLLTSNAWGFGLDSATLAGPFTQPLADKPVIKSLAGGASTATLRFLKPTGASNQDTITYRAQLYDAFASTATKRGDPVLLNVTGGTGSDADPYVASLGPFSQARVIAVAIQASGGAGGVSTDLSDQSNAVVVGTPAKPIISQASVSGAATASISITKAFTATKYTVTLVDVNNAANTASEVLTPADSEAGPWTSSLTAPAKGTYRFEVTAANEFDATSDKAVSEAAVVGTPDAPTLPTDAVDAGVGKITLKWTVPQTNAFIGTTYTAVLYRPANPSTPYLTLPLKAAGTTTAGTTSFSEELGLPAGPYRLEIATANVRGDGAKSSMTSEFTVDVSTRPAILDASGDTSGATLRVTRPDTLPDDAVATYLIQAFSDAEGTSKVGSEVRGNNTADGADGKQASSAFAFPYPYTTGAQLYFTVAVVVGTTRSNASLVYGPVVVGTPATPRLASPLGGKDGATFSFTAVPTAVKYVVTASKDGTALQPARTVTDASAQQVWSLADLGSEPGEFSFSVVAENGNGEQSEAATTPKLVVGTPGAPAWVASNPVVPAPGTATLSWTAPTYNAKIDTRYFVQLYRSADGPAFGSLVALTPTQGGNGTAQAPYTATISVSAGSWSYKLLTSNAWGTGEASAKTQAVEQAVADTPVLRSLVGGATTATLRFLKPTNTSDQDTVAYRAQLYDASTSPATKLGDPVLLNVTGGEGTDAQPYVATLGPFSQARVIAVAVQANGGAGGFSTALSAQSDAVVVGTPSKPGISQASGSNGATASLTISKVFTATNYTIVLVDVNSAANISEVLSPAAAEAGPWTRSLTAPAKGTYRFEVTATNEHKATSDKAVSEAVVVGVPDAPTLPADAVTADVGKITLKWTAPQTNAFIGTKYTALLHRPANTTVPYLILALKAAGSTSFSEELALPAGPYRLEIATANGNGDGAKSSMTSEFTVGVSTNAKILAVSGDTSGAELKVLRPDNMSDDAVATYLIQAYSDAAATTKVGTEVRGNNMAADADGKTPEKAFVFPYPYTTAAKLWFKVTVVVGGTRSPASDTSSSTVVGTPATPRLASPLGGNNGATFSFTAVPTAVKYIVTAFKEDTELQPARNVTTAGRQVWSLADLGGEPGQFTFSVVAENENGAQGEAATTPAPLVVGTPGAPAWAATNPVVATVGTARLSWTAPAYNAKIGARYYVQLFSGATGPKFGGLVALTTAGEGSAQAPFTATINITAGSWSYQLFTNNTWGAGGSSAKTAAFGQPVADTPSIKNLTGGESTATLRFLKPASSSDQDTIIYRAQLYDSSKTPPAKLGEPVVLNIADGEGTDADPYVATLGPFAQPLRITVALQASGGAGGVSTAQTTQSNAAVVGLPLVPQIESFTGSKTELRVTWLKNDTTATSYRIAVFKAGVFVAPVVEVPAASLGDAAGTAEDPFSFAIPAANRPEANRYAVKVAAVNANGAGPWSALSQVAVFGAPTAPSGVPAVALADPNVRVTFSKADSTAVKYSAFLKPTTGTEVEVPLAVKPVNDSTTQLFALVAPDPPELPQGGIYTLQIAAYNANDDLGTRSASSAAFQLGTVAPTAPVGVAANPSARAATVSFQAPASTGGSLITSYEVELLLAGDSQGVRTFQASALFKAGQSEGTATRPFSVALSNLAPGSWTFVVTAVNKNGRASAAATAPVTVPDVPPTKPAIAAISGTDSTVVSGVTTQTINLSVLKPRAGGEVTAWAYSLWNTARTVPFITSQPFTPTDGDGTTIDPYTAVLTIPNLPDGVYRVTVTATTATGSATSNFSPQVALGTPPTPTVTAVTSTTQNVTVRVSVPQTVTVAARNAKSNTKANTKAAKSISIAAGTTAASQPTVFTVTLNPTLGTGLKPLTRRVKSTGGTGTAGNPYTLVVPVATANEWTVQAVTGSNVNGVSDASDSDTVVATGTPAVASALATTNGLQAGVAFTSAPWWNTATTVRVRVLNPNNPAASQEVANRVLGATAITKPAANRWSVNVGTGGTATAPIPRAGIWRFQVALINSVSSQAALSAQTGNVEVGVPYQVGQPTVAQGATTGVILRVTINRTPTTAGVNNPPTVKSYIVRIFRGTTATAPYLRNVTFTAAQAATPQTIALTADGANSYSVSVVPVGVNGQGPESVRSRVVALARRTVTVPRTTGRKLAGAEGGEAVAARGTHAASAQDNDSGAPHNHKRRGRHLL